MSNEALNAMIEVLNEMSEEEDEDIQPVEDNQVQLVPQEEDQPALGSQPRHDVILISPVRQSQAVAAYRGSPSARRNLFNINIARRNLHCLFCNTSSDQSTLEQHLRGSQACLDRYKRKYEVRSLEAVLTKSFYCLFCQSKGPLKFQFHLEQSDECLQKYCRRYEVVHTRDVLRKIGNYARESHASRQPKARKIENAKAHEKKMNQQTCADALNTFRQKTALSNVYRCVTCSSFVMSTQVVEIEEDDVAYIEGFDMESIKSFKLFGKFWRCGTCDLSKVKTFEIPPVKLATLQVESTQNYLKYVPLTGEDLIDLDCSLEESQQELLFDDVDKPVTILYPSGSDGLEQYDKNTVSSLKNNDMKMLVHSGKQIGKEELEVFLSNQASKLKSAMESSNLFNATVHNNDNRTLVSLKRCTNENQVQGSFQWKRSRQGDLSFMLEQLGNYAFKFEAKVPVNGDDILASVLVQRRVCVTVDFVSNENMEQSVIYHVHEGHTAAEDCNPDSCNKRSMETFLIENNIDYAKYANSAFLCSLSQKLGQFINTILHCRSSLLNCSDHYFYIEFNRLGEALIVGVFWPFIVHDINLGSMTDTETKKLIRELLDNVDKVISTSSNKKIIQSQFNLSDKAAEEVLELVVNHQVHLSEHCDHCFDPPMPSLMTMFQETQADNRNLESGMRFIRRIRTILISLTLDEKETLSTFEFLQEVWDDRIDSFDEVSTGVWKLELDGEAFLFQVDQKLEELIQQFSNLPMAAFYQYSLCHVERKEDRKFLLKRLNLIDSFTHPYSPIALKAFKSTILIEPIFEEKIVWQLNYFDDDSLDGKRLPYHTEISLIEALSLADPSKLRVRSSRPTEFVYATPERRVKVKKVAANENNANCYRIEGDNQVYELQSSNITRYFDRLNGRSMTLAEFSIFYDFVGSSKSAELYNLYHGRLDQIQKSESLKSVIDGAAMELYIICGNQDVLQLREKKCKCLKFPTCNDESYELKFREVLLHYFPINSINDVNQETVDGLYNMREPGGSRLISCNRRKLLWNIRKAGFADEED